MLDERLMWVIAVIYAETSVEDVSCQWSPYISCTLLSTKPTFFELARGGILTMHGVDLRIRHLDGE